MIERKNKIYILNELHSIAVVKYKHFSILGRSPTGGMKKIIPLLIREAQTSYLRMRTHRVGKHFKNVSEQKFL